MFERLRNGRGRGRRGWVTAAAISLLGLSACDVPNNLWVNMISGGALTATNVLVSALANRTAEQLFGTTGSAGGGGDMGGEEEEGDHVD